MLIAPFSPNKFFQQSAPGVTTWVIIATDGTTYGTLALLRAAGKTPYPASNGTIGLDLGMKIQTLTMRSVTSAGADGSPFYCNINPEVTPTGTNGQLISGSGQQFVHAGHIWTVWVSLTTSTDTIELLGSY